ncbi:MAG: response regulator [Alphaproteobacteria bacterium]|nr:response regulator [Alphaproteobacteria bacterium]
MGAILVVDDDQDLRSSIALVLRDAGHDVIEAGDGREAIPILREREIAILITDLVMPGIEGMELVRLFMGKAKRPWIIVMSAHHGEERGDYLELAGKLGADCTLKKPFKSDQLLDAVRQATALKPA